MNEENICFLFKKGDEACKDAIRLMNYYKYHWHFSGQDGVYYGFKKYLELKSFAEKDILDMEIRPASYFIEMLKSKINAKNNIYNQKVIYNNLSKMQVG